MGTNNAVAIRQETVDAIEKRIHDLQSKGEIHFPQNYSASNALKSAYLMLQETVNKDGRPALEVCTRESVQNALFNMCLLALSPAKKQVYPIVRGTKLCMDTSYFGVLAATKRITGVIDIFAQVIYEGDEFEYTLTQGRKIITKHIQKLENINTDKIVGAYCTIVYGDPEKPREYTEVMSKAQINKSWSKTQMRTNTVQQEFPEEMAKRTVIKRTCKLFVNTSDDSDLIIEAYNESTTEPISPDQEVSEEIRDKANKEPIDVNYTVAPDDDAKADTDKTPEPDQKDPAQGQAPAETPPPSDPPVRQRKF